MNRVEWSAVSYWYFQNVPPLLSIHLLQIEELRDVEEGLVMCHVV